MPNIHQLVYISQGVEDLSYTDIRDILDVSRKHNSKENITGILIYRDGYFLQVLEGEKQSVHDLVSKIRIDERNYGLRVLIEVDSDERLFEKWTMAFLDGDIMANSTKDLIDLFEMCLHPKLSERHLILTMVKKFRGSAPELQ